MNNNKIKKLEELSSLKNLNTLGMFGFNIWFFAVLSHNRIKKLENLGKLKKLAKLCLSHNKIIVLLGFNHSLLLENRKSWTPFLFARAAIK